MIEVPATFRAMPRWWSDGTDWLDALPELVATQCARWELTPDGDVRHGSNALVVRVRRGDERLALRMSPPGDDVATEAAALRFWDGRGTVRLVAVDVERRAQLLEWVTPGRSLEQLPLAATAPVIGGVLRRLAVEAPADAPSTGDIIAADLPGWPGRWSALGRPGAEPTPDRGDRGGRGRTGAGDPAARRQCRSALRPDPQRGTGTLAGGRSGAAAG